MNRSGQLSVYFGISCANCVQIVYLHTNERKMKPQITIYLDQRRAKSGNLYPLKIRVWDFITRKGVLYPTKLDISESDFKGSWDTQRPRKELRTLRMQIEAMKAKAQEVADSLSNFTFEGFEKKLYMKTGSGIEIATHYQTVIEQFKRYGQIGTASNYTLSLKSMIGFQQKKMNRNFKGLTFYQINPEWLHDYEKYMVSECGRSITTVGIYLRPLRAIFNKAISDGDIRQDTYPFGSRKYKIPASRNVKKALNLEQLRVLRDATGLTDNQEKARDFWFFSFYCNGMNMKDIAMLKMKDIQNDKFHFYRAKTVNTNKSALKPITVFLNEKTKVIVAKYGKLHKGSDDYVFDIYEAEATPERQKQLLINFTRFINQHLQSLCKTINLPPISTYWARHSFATMSIRIGASMEMIQECMGHGNMITTKNYFAGFENDILKSHSSELMKF